MVMTDMYIVLKKIDVIQEILTADRNKRNEHSTKYNRNSSDLPILESMSMRGSGT